MAKTVAQIVVDALEKAGAKRVYGIPGDTINHLTDAIAKSDLRWVGVRHEEAGTFAAGGESYMTGELSVAREPAGRDRCTSSTASTKAIATVRRCF